MNQIDCPACEHEQEYDRMDDDDSIRAGDAFTLTCSNCQAEFTATASYHVFYTCELIEPNGAEVPKIKNSSWENTND